MTAKRNHQAAAPRKTPPSQTNNNSVASSSKNSPSNVAATVQSCLSAFELAASYVAHPDFIERVEFRSGNIGDILVLKQDNDQEFILRGIFQIARNDFYFTPDGNYDPNNSFNSKLQDVRLSCRLTAPTSTEYEFAKNDFEKCIDNLRRLEKLIKLEKGHEVTSAIMQHLQKSQFKLTHSLFELKPKDSGTAQDEATEPTDSAETTETTVDENDDDLGLEFAMETWPVSECVQKSFKELFATHDICPLIAYDTNKKIIPPTKYQSQLCGATIEVHFALLHILIKKSKKHIFLPVLRSLYILLPPSALPSSPHKRIRVSASPQKGKGRA